MRKSQLNVKLSSHTIAQIRGLAALRGESQANVVSIAIDRMAKEELHETRKAALPRKRRAVSTQNQAPA